MYSDNKQIRDVADVAAKIMYGQQPVTEKLHPNQQQLDVHEPEKDELTADDFKKLRAKKGGVVKEDDTGYQDRFAVKNGKAVKHNPEKGEHDEPHHVWADSPEHAVRKHATMNKPKTEEVAEGFKFNSHERGAAERLKDMRKNEKEAEKMDKLYSAMRKKREQDKLKKEEVEELDELSKSTLSSYAKKGALDSIMRFGKASTTSGNKKPDHAEADKAGRRYGGVVKAIDRLAKEEVKQIDELSINTLTRVKGAATSAASDASREGDEGKATKRYDLAGKASNKIETKNRAAGLKPSGQHAFEEGKQIDEVKMADLPSTKVQGRSYGSSRPEPHAVDVMKGPKEKELKDIEAEKKKKKFSEMVNLYQEKGLKSLSEMLVKEEPDNEQFTKELEDAKAKSEGKKRNTEIAKGAVQAVKQEELDINDINGVQMSTIEERHMTDGEMEKRETIVKSMKKGMAGFKDRYGDRAKNVMYATANKQAMKD
jgi:hypothetical protein